MRPSYITGVFIDNATGEKYNPVMMCDDGWVIGRNEAGDLHALAFGMFRYFRTALPMPSKGTVIRK